VCTLECVYARVCVFAIECVCAFRSRANYRRSGEGLVNVCTKAECLKLKEQSCGKILPCGHLCRGLAGERVCVCVCVCVCSVQIQRYCLLNRVSFEN